MTPRFRNDVVNQRYIYYYLKANEPYIKSFAIGAAATTITKENVRNLRIKLPSRLTQDKIDSILSSYDNLIENNNRRIKILEKMAQTIYDEWFVKFRFPGHSKVKMVDSELGKIPEGWKVKSIMEAGHWDFINENIKQYEGEKEYFATANIEGINIIKDGEWVEYATKPSRAQKEPIVCSVWFARMRNTYKLLGFTDVNKDIAEKSILSSGFAGFKSSDEVYPFLYYTVNSQKFHILKDQFCTGATQMALTNDGLSRIRVIVPMEELIKKYSQIVLPMIDNIFVLQKKNKVLQQTRDILLPKLISGEIDVENMDIDIGDVDDR